MKKTGFYIMLILLLLAGLATATGAAGDEPEGINLALNGRSYTFQEGDPVVIYSRWGACSPGLVRAGIRAINWEVTLDTEPLLTPDDVDELWGPVKIYDTPPPIYQACVGKGKPAIAYWQFELLGLETGTYELHASMRYAHPIIDGGDYDSDGKPDRFTPEHTLDTVNYVTVNADG